MIYEIQSFKGCLIHLVLLLLSSPLLSLLLLLEVVVVVVFLLLVICATGMKWTLSDRTCAQGWKTLTTCKRCVAGLT